MSNSATSKSNNNDNKTGLNHIEFIKSNTSLLNALKAKTLTPLRQQLVQSIGSKRSSDLLYGLVRNTPRLISGNKGNAFMVFEMIDLETLEWSTNVICEFNMKYKRNLEIKNFNFPNSMDLIVLSEAILIQGNEKGSRPAFTISNKGGYFNLRKAGIPKSIIKCPTKGCNVIVKKGMLDICDKHIQIGLEKSQGQRMELSYGTHGIKLFVPPTKEQNGLINHTQHHSVQGGESYLLDSGEVVTVYYGNDANGYSLEEYKKKEEWNNKVRQILCLENNAGAEMLRVSIKGYETVSKKDRDIEQATNYEKGVRQNNPLSIEACTLVAKRMIKNEGLNNNLKKSKTGIDYFEKYNVGKIIRNKAKLKEIINKPIEFEELQFTDEKAINDDK